MAFFGMRGSGDWGTNQAPEDWEQLVLREFPNGMAPLYAMSSLMRTENVKSSTYHWQNKEYPTMAFDVVADEVYINTGLTTKYVRATHQATIGIAGGTVYVKIDNTDQDNDLRFAQPSMKVVLRDSDRPKVDVVGIIRDVFVDGANSFIAVELNEADDNDDTAATYNLTTVDRAILLAPSFPEGSTPPPGLVYDPTEYENFTEIQRNTFEETRTARSEELRYGQGYQDDKLDCLEFQSRGAENDFLWGVKRHKTASGNSKSHKFQMGIVEYIRTYSPANNYADFRIDHASDTWLSEGKTWLNNKLRQLFRWSSGELMVLCGDGFAQGIVDLAEFYGNINLETGQRDYGIETTVWRLPFGRLHLKTHPLFSIETTNEYSGIVLNPRNFRKVYLVNNSQSGKVQFQNDLQVSGLDGTHEGFIEEKGSKFYNPKQWGYLTSVGLDGPSS